MVWFIEFLVQDMKADFSISCCTIWGERKPTKVAVSQHKGKMQKIKIRTEQEKCISITMEEEKTHQQKHSNNR